ncbi:MAG: MltA domain-containing protein [Pseudomonadota bacterium]
MTKLRSAGALLLLSALTACAGIIPPAAERASRPPPETIPQTPETPPTVPAPPTAANALGQGVRSGPSVASLDIGRQQAERALATFRISCPSLLNREEQTGLTVAFDWVAPCEAASSWRDDPEDFFAEYFRTVEVGSGQAFATGYYEPEIAAARERRDGYEWPVYALPDDIPQSCAPECGEDSSLTRAAIENGALEGQGLAIAWARDLVDLYFLQVQGSGILRLPDGDAMRIGYAGNNGYPYTSIGRLMRERGLLGDGQTTAEGIATWLRENPDRGREIMQENRRYIFFTEVNGPGPLGSLGRPVTPRATVAADPDFVPLGAPVFLDLEHDVADGLWIAQDTGSAIRGANRFDTFWGAGDEAYAIASGMASRGQAYILIPAVSAARFRAD